MNDINLIYKLEGSDLNSVDVLELAPILLSLGKLIQESRSILLPDSNEISVNVRPFEKGSFIVDLSVVFNSNFEQLVDLVKNSSKSDVVELIKTIGLISGSGTASLIGLYKFLKGKPKKIVPDRNAGTFTYVTDDDNSMTVDIKTNALYQSKTVQESMYGAFCRPLQSHSVDKISSYIKEDHGEPTDKVEVTKNEASYFEPQDVSKLLDESEEETEQVSEIFLKPKRGSYEGEGYQWSFRRSDQSAEIITATIRDDEFLQKVRSGEIRPFHEDLLKVRLLTKQKVRGNELSESKEIINVLDYRPAVPQPPLFELEDENQR